MMRRRSAFIPWMVILIALMLSACSPQASTDADNRIDVVATTTIVGDVVRVVGGEAIDLKVLVPAGVDEHSYEPTAQDMVAISNAEVIFYNGAGLEPFMERLLESAGKDTRIQAVSEGIPLQRGLEEVEPHADENGEQAGDPHVWTDPNNVVVWAENIARTLVEADPRNAAQFDAQSSAYKEDLAELDVWIQAEVEQLPAERRKLVTDHTVFTYFAKRYGFEQVGAVVPGYSTLASPSAQEIAALEDSIRALDVTVIFTGSSFNPALAQRVADDTGTRLVQVQTGSLTGPDGRAPTYLEYMRFNVKAIVEALK